MRMANGVNDMTLAHEIAVDNDFKFHEAPPAEDRCSIILSNGYCSLFGNLYSYLTPIDSKYLYCLSTRCYELCENPWLSSTI